jgi:hypothetical protein
MAEVGLSARTRQHDESTPRTLAGSVLESSKSDHTFRVACHVCTIEQPQATEHLAEVVRVKLLAVAFLVCLLPSLVRERLWRRGLCTS